MVGGGQAWRARGLIKQGEVRGAEGMTGLGRAGLDLGWRIRRGQQLSCCTEASSSSSNRAAR